MREMCRRRVPLGEWEDMGTSTSGTMNSVQEWETASVTHDAVCIRFGYQSSSTNKASRLDETLDSGPDELFTCCLGDAASVA